MQLLHELKRRNVFRVAAAYIVSAWLIIQVAETIFPAFGFSDGAVRAVIITLVIALIPVSVLSWVFELTPEGLKLDKNVNPAQSGGRRTAKMLDRGILVVLVMALSYFAFDKFLLDPARDAEQIETARREGRSEALVATFGERSIAVLPFADMSPSGDQSYFSDGISEELLNLLAGIPEVRVTSRSSAFSFKGQSLSIPEMARRLNVSYILDGSVRKAGDQLRISAQLIEAASDTQLWSKNFDRTLDNVFQIQDEIAGDVVEQIKGTLKISVPEQRKTNPEAYSLFLQARQQRRLGTAEGYVEAISLYRQALAIDPNYPPAWDEMAAAYQSQALTGLRPAAEGFGLGREAALTAIEIDPDYAPAYDSLGFISQYFDVDLAMAAGYFKRALELAPRDTGIIGSAGMLLQNIGRLEQGLAPIEYTVASDPLSPGWHYTLGLAYLAVARHQDAIRSFETTLALSPDFSLGYYNLGVALMLDGRPAEAITALQKENRENWRLAGLSMALFAEERELGIEQPGKSEADVALARLEQEHSESSPYNIAYVHAYRGDRDAAFRWLEKAVEVGDPGVGGILSEALFVNLHDDARWIPFLRRVGRSPEELAKIELPVTLPK